MTNRKFMYFLALGGFELSVILFFISLSIIFSVIGNDYTSYLYKLKILVVVISITVSVWGFFNRKRAICYLVASGIRWLLFIATAILLQDIHPSENSYFTGCCLCISLLQALIVTSIYFFNFNIKWDYIFKMWQKIGKIDFKKHRFNIGAMGIPMTESKMKHLEKVVIPICVAGVLLLVYLTSYFKLNFKLILLRISILGMLFIISVATASAIATLINLIKIEKQMGIRFKTEFADDEEPDRSKKTK
jgi:hypothetical protein